MTARPKVQIVRAAVRDVEVNDVEIYIDGKFIAGASRANHTAAGLAAIESVARHVARALGADVEAADEPDRQPYRYFVTYVVTHTGIRAALAGWTFGVNVHGSKWFDLADVIGGPDDLVPLIADIMKVFTKDGGPPVRVAITGFTCIDGPF